jgi:formate C-acetyltransferase
MSMGRISTFLDIYIERDLGRGAHEAAGAGDHRRLVIKLRIVRFLRTPDYDELFSGDPYLGHRVDRRHGRDGRTLVTKIQLPHAADPLQPRPGTRSRTSRSVVEEPAGEFQALCVPRSARTPRSLQYENDDLMRPFWGDDYAIACCVSAMQHRQADAVLRRARQPRQVHALRDQRRTRRGERRAGGPAFAPVGRRRTSTSKR